MAVAVVPPRRLLAAVLLFPLLALGGCLASLMPSVDSEGASLTATQHLARIRAGNGLPALASDPMLEKAARQQAAYMAGSRKMEHSTGWGRDFTARVRDNGIVGAAAENIARGRMDLDRLFAMWMASSGHRRNMLDPRFSRFGLAHAGEGDQRYWALILGR